MPLLEINQIRHICASFGWMSPALHGSISTAFIHTSADDAVDKAPNHAFSKDRDF
jgi:hypothetical protein